MFASSFGQHAARFDAERRGGALPPPPEPEASVGGAVGAAAADALYVAGSVGSSFSLVLRVFLVSFVLIFARRLDRIVACRSAVRRR